jgi:uroporphyrinogen III methyltransferase/synthase
MKSTATTPGIVHLVGAGPGDIGLFTLRGMELLQRAQVVVYDGLANPDLLRHAPPGAELICADKHRRHRQRITQDEINATLLAKAREGKRVVRLKGGDPFIFGRGGEEAEVLAEAGIPYEVVPGVSSFYSVPAYAGIPVTHRKYNSSVTVVTGHEETSTKQSVDWPTLAKTPGTLVILMGLKSITRTTTALLAHGRPPETPVAVISQGTTEHQRTLPGTLATIAAQVDHSQHPMPALIVIGEVVRMGEKLAWKK